MFKFLILSISVFASLVGRGQTALTVPQVDSIVAAIDANTLSASYNRVDSAQLSSTTRQAVIYSYKKLKRTGQIEKIERIGNGTCSSKETYYFFNGKLIKAVVKMSCNGELTWDSELYYHNDTAFAQKDKAAVLHGPVFKETAYNDRKRIIQLEEEKQ
jgi:hypothetical protein